MDRLLNARALGVEDALSDGNDEMAGDINVKGDTQETHYHYGPPAQQPAVQPIGAAPASSPATPNPPVGCGGSWRWALPAAAILGVPLLGFGGAAAYQFFKTQRPAIQQPLNNLGIKPGIHVSPTP